MTETSEPRANLTPGARRIVTIGDIAFGGEGVARVEDLVVFVPFVAVGEAVEVEIVEVKRRFARARLVRVLKVAAERVTPRCRYFGECGGCQYQHLDYGVQLRLKHKQVADLFQRIGGLERAVVQPVVPCPRPYGYRNRIMVRSQWNKPRQGLDIGFLRWDNRLLVDIEECQIAEPVLSEQIKRVRALPPPKGGLKVVLRVAPEGWDVPGDCFFQNNFHLLPRLVETVRERIRASGVRHLVDAYCGVGFFCVELADLVESFVGVEIASQAIRAARRNAASRGRANGEFLAGRTEELVGTLVGRFPPETTAVVLDPPRTGCPKATLELLRESCVAQILYVSCHPATLARDLNVLCAGGVYQPVTVVPLDMFPQTQHVECVADLRLRAGAADASAPAGAAN
jgi:tRNA/tmRNA/rRNA uracil-C5-methylase (TrmA/RlmC/RlmD family)